MKAISIRTLVVLALLALMLPLTARASGAVNPAFWKHEFRGEFATVLADLKAGLEAKQFIISGEENLARGLENNKAIFGLDRWNTIGFRDATAIHFCSLVIKQEVFNLNMDWSILCPFKVVAYTMRNRPGVVTVVTIRPTHLLARDPHPQAREVGRRMEQRITEALLAGGGR